MILGDQCMLSSQEESEENNALERLVWWVV